MLFKFGPGNCGTGDFLQQTRADDVRVKKSSFMKPGSLHIWDNENYANED